jgi:hypothetical protein
MWCLSPLLNMITSTFNHFPANYKTTFFFTDEKYSIVHINHSEHLGWFHILAIMNIAISMGRQVLCCMLSVILLGIYTGKRKQDYREVLNFFLKSHHTDCSISQTTLFKSVFFTRYLFSLDGNCVRNSL